MPELEVQYTLSYGPHSGYVRGQAHSFERVDGTVEQGAIVTAAFGEKHESCIEITSNDPARLVALLRGLADALETKLAQIGTDEAHTYLPVVTPAAGEPSS